MKHEFSRQIFGKYLNFMKIRPMGAELSRADRRTDKHGEANSRSWQLRESA
jgi:hypothetical protein